MPVKQANRNIQTTLRLPRPLYEQAKSLVQSGLTDAQSINELMVGALRAYLNMLGRRQIDAAFARMAQDAHYQKQAQQIAEDFEESDWEALRIAEKASRKVHGAR